MKKICVVGLGYIGFPTSLMFASHGNTVIGIDKNEKLVNTLNEGKTTFKEKGLDELFLNAVSSGITFSHILPKNDFYIVAVPTPYNEVTKKIDPIYVVNAVREVLEICEDNCVLVIESTISPGTIDKYVRPIVNQSNKKIHLVHCPERIIPGNMVYELEHNSRTIGADSNEIGEKVKEAYKTFCKGDIVLTDIKTAEMTKVVENTFRDINIAFANELVQIAEKAGMDVYEIIKIANMHPRVNILQPGPGVGGHCISVDPWFLVGDYPEEAKLIKQAREINSNMPLFVLNKIKNICIENGISLDKVGLYGLTYKENVDDVRESPTLQLLEFQNKAGEEQFKCYDPLVTMQIADNQFFDFDEFINTCDLIVIMQSHNHIKDNQKALLNKIVFDTKHMCLRCKKEYKL